MSGAAPLVSVVVPCFNQGHYAYESVMSAKTAYGGPLEIIIVDDGSTNSLTRRQLDEAAREARDARCRIEILSQDNRGLSGARNRGLAQAGGEFVQLLDCDDLLLPGKLDRQVMHFEVADAIDVSVAGCVYANEIVDSFEKHPQLLADSNYDLLDFATKWERGFSLPIHCALFRRTVFATHAFDERLRAKEDWLFWSRLAAAGARIAFLGGPGVIYRVHDASLCRASPDVGRQWLMSALEIDALARPSVPDFLDGAVGWYLKTYAAAARGAEPAPPAPAKLGGVARKTVARKAAIGRKCASNPRVSIVIPVYEHFEFLERCLASAEAQCDEDVEIVLVDDGSRDPRVRLLLQDFAARVDAKLILQRNNCGVSSTLNKGVAAAAGEYVAFLDCDDLLEPDAMRKALGFLESHPDCDYLFTDRYDIDDDDGVLRLARYGGYRDDRFTGDFRQDLLNGMIASHLKVIRRSSIVSAGGFDPEASGVQDWALALRIAEFGRFGYLAEPLYAYRSHANTVTFSDRRRQFVKTNIVRRRFAERYFKQRDVHNRFRDGERAEAAPRKVVPSEISVRGLSEQWSARPLHLDTTAGVTKEDIWLIREFNSYFDKILWSSPEIHAALLGYVWALDVLQAV